MKNKLLLGLLSTGVILSSTSAYALTGNATVDFTGKDIINVGDTFTVSMNVKNVTGTTDGIVSLGGNLVFDSNVLEYVSSSSEKAPYMFDINEDANYKIAGLDFTLDKGILENTTVYEFTFKALSEGNTTITLENYKLTDSQDYVDTTVIAKNIKVNSIEEVKPVEKEEKEEIKEEKVNKTVKVENTKKEIKTEKITNKETKKEMITIRLNKILNEILTKLNKLFK